MSQRSLVLMCVAPKPYRTTLKRGIRRLGLQFRFITRPNPIFHKTDLINHSDPYGLSILIANSPEPIDGVLLVASAHHSPANAVPAPLVAGVPIGVLFSRSPKDLLPWIEALSNQQPVSMDWAILSRWDRFFYPRNKRLAQKLRKAHPTQVHTWFADDFTREEVCELLSTGPRLVWYTGHAHIRGLSAYHGLYWEHLKEVQSFSPCGTVMSLACDTLNTYRNILPFGCQWILGGRATTFFGSVKSSSIDGTMSLCFEIRKLLEKHQLHNFGQLMIKIEERLLSVPSLRSTYEVFRSYRIVGNPLQGLYSSII